jgi:GNAT superfamily N-acetyltransferase
MDIRPAEDQDLHLVTRLSKEWVRERITYTLIPTLPKQLSTVPKDLRLIAWEGKKPIGYAFGRVLTYRAEVKGLYTMVPSGTRYFSLSEIFVTKPYRTKGVGSALLKAIMRNAKKQGIRNFDVLSKSRNIEGVERFYERHGFKTYMVHMAAKK